MAALVGLGLGWYEVSGTSDVYAQLPYFFSFGGTVLALMLAAAALFIDYEHSCDRQGIALLLERLETIEEQMSAGRDVALPGTTRPETAER